MSLVAGYPRRWGISVFRKAWAAGPSSQMRAEEKEVPAAAMDLAIFREESPS